LKTVSGIRKRNKIKIRHSSAKAVIHLSFRSTGQRSGFPIFIDKVGGIIADRNVWV